MESNRRGLTWLAVVVALVALLMSANAIDNDLTYDSYYLVTKNDTFQTAAARATAGGKIESLLAVFQEEFWDGVNRLRDPTLKVEGQALYRPLMMTTLGLVYLGFGGDPVPYNVLNVLLHALTAVLVLKLAFAVARDRRVAFLAGLLFAAHPIHSEAVASAAGIGETQAAFFGLAAVLLYLNGATRERMRPLHLAGAALCFAAALFTKEGAAVVLVLAVLADLARGDRAPRFAPRFAAYLALAAVVAVNVWVRLRVCGQLAPSTSFISRLDNPLIREDFMTRLATGAMLYAKALHLFLWPVGQASDYSFNQLPIAHSLAEPAAFAAFATCAVLTVAGLAALRSWPALGFGLLAFLFAFGPVSNIALPIGTIFAERVLYLPSVGLSIAAGALIARALALLEARTGETAEVAYRVARSAFVVVLVALVVAGAVRNRKYRSHEVLYEDMVRTAPESARGYYQRGVFAQDQGRFQAAINDFRESIRIMPDFIHPMRQLGLAYAMNGEQDRGIETLNQLIAMYQGVDGGQAVVDTVRADLVGIISRYRTRPATETAVKPPDNDKIIAKIEEQIRIHPDEPALVLALIPYYIAEGRIDEARALADQRLQADPTNEKVKVVSASVAMHAGDFERLRTLLDELKDSQDPWVAQVVTLYRGVLAFEDARLARLTQGTKAAHEIGAEARRLLQEYIAAAPGDHQGYWYLGQLLQDVFVDLEGAAQQFQQVLARFPHLEAALRMHQITAHLQKFTPEVVAASDKLLAEFRQNETFLQDRAMLLAGVGRFREAAEAQAEAIRLGLDGVAPRSYLAQYLTSDDRPGEALSMLREAEASFRQRFGRDFPELAHASGVALLEMKDHAGAAAEFARAVELAKELPALEGQVPLRKFHLDKTLLHVGGREREGFDGLQELRANLAAHRDGDAEDILAQPLLQRLRPFVLRQLAWARMNVAELKDVADATELLEEATRLAPELELGDSDQADLFADLALAYEQSDRIDDARESLQKALRLRRADKDLQQRLDALKG